MNKNTKIVLGVVAIVLICIAAHLYFKNEKSSKENKDLKKIIDENEEMSQSEKDALIRILDEEGKDYQRKIEELESIIEKNKAISDKDKHELHELILHYGEIDSDIAEQLTKALEFLSTNNPLEAIRKLGVLAEYLLEKLYKGNEKYEAWIKQKKKPHNVSSMLLYCKEEDRKISNSEYGALYFLKEIRNEESHNISVKLDDYIQKSGLLVAIGGIKTLSMICYPPNEGA